MKIATWNVNSLRVRLAHLLAWLAQEPVDVVCLQETKLTDDKFPVQALADAGYACAFDGQPTYNGVAILTRRQTVGEATEVVRGNPLRPDDGQKRLISAKVAGVRIVNGYFPNGQSLDSDKYVYKLGWLDHLHDWLKPQLDRGEDLVLVGDFNIAPTDADVHDPVAWAGQVLCSAPERDRFQALLALGLHDAFRLFEQAPRSFTWWDYRQLAFRKNQGLRIDHILVSQGLSARVRACQVAREIRKLEQASDHAPVVVTLDD